MHFEIGSDLIIFNDEETAFELLADDLSGVLLPAGAWIEVLRSRAQGF
jgi:hypothetical protein